MAKLTLSSTKETILDAYEKKCKELEEVSKVRSNPAEEAKKKKASTIVEKAETVLAANVSLKVKAVSEAVTKALGELLEKIQEETDNYMAVKEAITLKQQELKDLFGIETNAHALAGIVNAKADMIIALDAEIAELKEELTSRKMTIDTDVADYQRVMNLNRKKDQDEYVYNFNRQKMIDKDAWTDEMKVARAKFTETLNAELASVNATMSAISAKEAELVKREAFVADLEKKVAEIPVLVDAAAAKAVADKEKSLQTAFAIEKNYLKKDAESQALLAQAKIDSLVNDVARSNKAADDLAVKLDAAYAKIESMARASVEAASGAKYTANLEQMVRDSKPTTTK